MFISTQLLRSKVEMSILMSRPKQPFKNSPAKSVAKLTASHYDEVKKMKDFKEKDDEDKIITFQDLHHHPHRLRHGRVQPHHQPSPDRPHGPTHPPHLPPMLLPLLLLVSGTLLGLTVSTTISNTISSTNSASPSVQVNVNSSSVLTSNTENTEVTADPTYTTVVCAFPNGTLATLAYNQTAATWTCPEASLTLPLLTPGFNGFSGLSSLPGLLLGRSFSYLPGLLAEVTSRLTGLLSDWPLLCQVPSLNEYIIPESTNYVVITIPIRTLFRCLSHFKVQLR